MPAQAEASRTAPADGPSLRGPAPARQRKRHRTGRQPLTRRAGGFSARPSAPADHPGLAQRDPLCTLCISRKHLIPDHASPPTPRRSTTGYWPRCSPARSLTEQYETDAGERVARERRAQAGQDRGAPPTDPELRPAGTLPAFEEACPAELAAQFTPDEVEELIRAGRRHGPGQPAAAPRPVSTAADLVNHACGLLNSGADARTGAPVYVVTRADVERIAN
jgi:hypothetical protein